MQTLVRSWREAWSNETEDGFPFGIVELAGGTSEGFPHNMGAFRFAQRQAASLPGVFVVQGHDAGDPCEGGGQCCVNDADGQGGWACMSGEAPYTGQFMGGIHPST